MLDKHGIALVWRNVGNVSEFCSGPAVGETERWEESLGYRKRTASNCTQIHTTQIDRTQIHRTQIENKCAPGLKMQMSMDQPVKRQESCKPRPIWSNYQTYLSDKSWKQSGHKNSKLQRIWKTQADLFKCLCILCFVFWVVTHCCLVVVSDGL